MKSSTGGNAASAPRSEPSRKAGDLRTRAISALVLGPLALAAMWLGGWVFQALVALAAVLSMREWMRLTATGAPHWVHWFAGLAALAVLAVHAAAGPLAALGLAVAGGIVVAALAGGALAGAGLLYVMAGMVGLAWLRADPAGLPLILFLFLIVWACDIGAYAAGRTIGGPKLAPRISPKKTWAGLIGGVVSSALIAVGVAAVAGTPESRGAMLAGAALVGAVLAVVSQGGDLFESWVKRRYNVKDSGSLIPGHGGLLDRIDGLLVAAPVLALFHATWGTGLAWW